MTTEPLSGRYWRAYHGKAHLIKYTSKGIYSVCGESTFEETPPSVYGIQPCEKCVEAATAADFIIKTRDGAERKYTFPTLSKHGTGCSGYDGVYCSGVSVRRPDIAFTIALIQYGYQTMKICDNSPPTHACRCKERLAEMGDVLARIGVENDTGWVGTKGGRCITDYRREIRFTRDLTPQEQIDVTEYLGRKDCPGWTGVHKHGSGSCFAFTTTMDSSD